MNRRRTSPGRAVARGLMSGVVGGLLASYVMTQFQSGVAQLSKPKGESGGQPEGGEDATVKTAAAVSESAFGHELTRKEKEVAATAVHYAFGAIMGALYGVVAEVAPAATAGWGLPFGIVLWLAADEVAVPALGLSKPPAEYPASTHASALGAHLVYGLSVDLVRRVIRKAF